MAHSDILTLHLWGISEKINCDFKHSGCRDSCRCLGSGPVSLCCPIQQLLPCAVKVKMAPGYCFEAESQLQMVDIALSCVYPVYSAMMSMLDT